MPVLDFSLPPRLAESGHHDDVERRLFGPSVRAVAQLERAVADADFLQDPARPIIERRDAFNRINLSDERSQDRGLVAGAGAHLQNAVAGARRGDLGHDGDQVGLRDGLLVADRQWAVVVGALGILGRDKRWRGIVAWRSTRAGR